MISDIEISNIILQIIDNGYISNKIDVQLGDDHVKFLFLFNSLIMAHVHRYKNCFDENSKVDEINNAVKDSRTVFCDRAISDNLVSNIIRLCACENFKSVEFREACVQTMEELVLCKIDEIQNVLLKKIVHIIISSCLYSSEPFIGILRSATDMLSQMETTNEEFINILLLE